jgi:hypothetical protein
MTTKTPDSATSIIAQLIAMVLAIGFMAAFCITTGTRYQNYMGFKFTESNNSSEFLYPYGVKGIVDGKEINAVSNQIPLGFQSQVGMCYMTTGFYLKDSPVYHITKSTIAFSSNCK